MSFFGDLHQTGAGKEIQRSANVIQDTLIDKPRRRARVDKLEKERAEDRLVQKELQGYTLAQARADQKLFGDRQQLANINLANETSQAKKDQQQFAARNRMVDINVALQGRTMTASAHKQLMEKVRSYGLTDERGFSPAWTLKQAETEIAGDVESNNKFIAGEVGAHRKSLSELNFLATNWDQKGAGIVDEGEGEKGIKKFKRILMESGNSARYNGNIDKNQETPLTLGQVNTLIELRRGILAGVEDRKPKKDKLKVTLFKGGRTAEVFQGTSYYNQLINDGWNIGLPVKPNFKQLAENRKVREEERKIKAAKTKLSVAAGKERLSIRAGMLNAGELIKIDDPAQYNKKGYANKEGVIEYINLLNDRLRELGFPGDVKEWEEKTTEEEKGVFGVAWDFWFGNKAETKGALESQPKAAKYRPRPVVVKKAIGKPGEKVKAKQAEPKGIPPAAKHNGRIVKDTETGKRYKSDGTRWIEIK